VTFYYKNINNPMKNSFILKGKPLTIKFNLNDNKFKILQSYIVKDHHLNTITLKKKKKKKVIRTEYI